MLKSEVQKELYIMAKRSPVSRVNLDDLDVYQICEEGTTWYHNGIKVVSDGKQQSHHQMGMVIQSLKLQGRIWIPDTTFTPNATFEYANFMVLDDYMDQCQQMYSDEQQAKEKAARERQMEIRFASYGLAVTVTDKTVVFSSFNSIGELFKMLNR